MNDITFAASRLAVHRANDLARIVEHRRAIAERAAQCVLPPVREHPFVRFPRFSELRFRFPGTAVG
ncbi:MAG TPA: hypothetical protein VNP97_13380 [Microbacterium sp.]|nr:hypothetical protein [Microbacterium sp.]